MLGSLIYLLSLKSLELDECAFEENKLYLSDKNDAKGSRFITSMSSAEATTLISNSVFKCAPSTFCDLNNEPDLTYYKTGFMLDFSGVFTLQDSSVTNCFTNPEGIFFPF